MRFIVKSYPLSDDSEPNTCYLVENTWNDFGFYTLFRLHYSDEKRSSTEIGWMKIMKKGQESGPVILYSRNFNHLDESYCSLGNSQSFYEEMYNLPKPVRNQILESLRDCVYNSDIYNDFKSEKAMQDSLLRDVSNRNVKESFKNILLNKDVLTPYNFSFQLKSKADCKIDVRVIPKSTPPTNPTESFR